MPDALYQNPVALWLFAHGVRTVSWLLVLLAAGAYAAFRPGERLGRIAAWLLGAGIAARVLLAAWRSLAQYGIWEGDPLGQLFLPPHQPYGYLLAYVGLRFLLPVGLALLCAGLWYGLMRALRARTERYFDTGEIALTTLLVFAVGWPGFALLLPLAAAALVLLSMGRLALLGERLTTLGIPVLAAALATLAFGGPLLRLFGIELY